MGISDQTAVNRLSEANWAQIKEALTVNFRFTVNGSLPIEKGSVTGGSLKEVKPKPESKLTQGLDYVRAIRHPRKSTGKGMNITVFCNKAGEAHASLGY